MRDPERIDPILEDIKEFWHAHPDLRFGQVFYIILENCPEKYYGKDVFFVEDDVWKEMTSKLIER